MAKRRKKMSVEDWVRYYRARGLILGTVSGRLSSKEPSVMNIPKQLDEKGPFTRPTAPADPKPAFFTSRSNPGGRFED